MMTTLRFQSFPFLAAATLAGAAIACSDNPTAVRGTPGIQVLSTYQPDTIEAILTSPFVAIVRDSTGLPLAGALVTIFGAQGPFADAEMTVAPVDATSINEYAGGLQETTDANGKVSVRLRLGTVVPRGRLVIAVPVAGYRDTISFAVLP